MKEFMKKYSVFIGQNRYCVYFHYHAKGTGHTACCYARRGFSS